MKKILLILFTGFIACALVASALAGDCAFKVQKHERHTTSAQKRAVFLAAGVPYDKAHRPLYVVDHVVSLELGGTDTVDNMQLQSIADGHAKDKIENALARCVCLGETPLPVAQTWVLRWREVSQSVCPKQ